MNLAESFRAAMRALLANKARSALTVLGVVIGVAAVILLVAIGTGVRNEITGSLESLGSNLLFVFPGKLAPGRSGGIGGADITKKFTVADADYLQSQLRDSAVVVPVLQATAPVSYRGTSQTTRIAASNENGNGVFNAQYALGRHYTHSQVQTAAHVVLLGSQVRENLFGATNPLGASVKINGQAFTVIGVLAPRGGGLTGNEDNQVYIPVTTAQQLLGVDRISSIVAAARNPKDVEVVKGQIERLMRLRYGDRFTVFTQRQTLGVLSTLLGTLTVMLAGLAGISLLVGGIGIMNIMLVSVSERTREIGVRKAVGARTYDILSQFVIESVVLAVAGGAAGIALGWLGAVIVNRWVATDVTWWSVALAFFFSAAVGVFFGVYPAWRASQLDPITALRYE